MVPRPPRQPTPALALAAAILLAFVAACTTTEPTGSPSTSAGPSGDTVAVRAYFLVPTHFGPALLMPVVRQVSVSGDQPTAAVQALLAGPSDAERGANPRVMTSIPAGSELLRLEVVGGTATVNLGSAFSPDSVVPRNRLAQVVFTLTQFAGIAGVRIQVAGVPVALSTPDGVVVDRPVNRLDFTDQLPVVFLDTPAWGDRVASPAKLTGLANVFEANFHIRILDATGHSLADGPVMATCGSGCWGTFEVSVPFTVNAPEAGMVQVYALSAADGSIESLVTYPVTLTP